jgi:hypothetical protein
MEVYLCHPSDFCPSIDSNDKVLIVALLAPYFAIKITAFVFVIVVAIIPKRKSHLPSGKIELPQMFGFSSRKFFSLSLYEGR